MAMEVTVENKGSLSRFDSAQTRMELHGVGFHARAFGTPPKLPGLAVPGHVGHGGEKSHLNVKEYEK